MAAGCGAPFGRAWVVWQGERVAHSEGGVEVRVAPDAAAQLVAILPWAEGQGDAVGEVQGVVGEGEQLRLTHRVAVVVGVLACGQGQVR